MHTSRFSGLMSLWTMFKLCRYFSALARLYTMTLASLSVYLAEEVMASNKSPPCENMTTVFYTAKREMTPLPSATHSSLSLYCTFTSSITRYSSEGVSTSSINMMMLGCFTFRSTATSFSMRCS